MKEKSRRQLQLFLEVRDVTPVIWRRILVDASSMDLKRLHAAIQILMGWYDYHLHEFSIDGKYYAPPSDEDDREIHSERKRLSTIFRTKGKTILYNYDFGDDWVIELSLECEDLIEGQIPKVTCIAGREAGPIEDSGGPFGYMEKLQILADPTHPEYGELLEWMPTGFDAEKVDFQFINEGLAFL